MINIDYEKCISCGQCVKDCFRKKIVISGGRVEYTGGSCMECGHCVAVCPVGAVTLMGYDMSEVQEIKEPHNLDADFYLAHLKERRSIRQFKPDPVSEEDIRRIIEAGRFSPTGSNLQNVSYFVSGNDIDNFRREVMLTLKAIGENSLKSSAPLAYAKRWIDLCDDYMENGVDELFFNAGTVIVISSESPQAAIIAAAHMETMIYSMGLGMLYSGFTTRAINNSPKLREYVRLKEGQNTYAVLVVGRPAVKYRRTVPRKPADINWD